MGNTVLALDMATKTGWASYKNGNIESGVQDFSLKRGESVGMRYLKFTKWLVDINDLLDGIDLIVYEQPHYRGGHATEVLVGLLTHMKSFVSKLEGFGQPVNTAPVHSGTLKKHATGAGKASKFDMMEKGREKGWTFQDDNECDALWLLDYGLKEYYAELPEKK